MNYRKDGGTYVSLGKAGAGTYFFDSWSKASEFCEINRLPVDCIEAVYTTYKVTITN